MKLLASNYDGTLCYGKHVMEEDSQAIRQWQANGNLFTIVTGRAKESLDKYLKKDGLYPDYIVTNNGSVIFDKDGNEIESNFLDYITALDVMYIAKQTDGVVSYVVNDGRHRHRIIVNPNLQDVRYPHMKPDLTEEEVMDKQGGYSQIVLSMSNPDMASALAEELNIFFSENITAYANNYCVDVVPKGISKGTGLEFVTNYLDLDVDDVYAIGNLEKDIPMLEFAGNSYAFFTAFEEIKAVCDHEVMSIAEMIKDIETE